jgi:hypothetical protein
MAGWKELSAKADKTFEQIADSSNTLLLCGLSDDYCTWFM